MKLREIKVGGRYLAKVSGRPCVVQVVALQEMEGLRGVLTRIQAVNEATGRRITIRSPRRLQARVED